MTFEEKVALIEKGRESDIVFDEYVKELLASGMSTVGAYNSIALEKIPGYKAPVAKPAEPKPAVAATKTLKK